MYTSDDFLKDVFRIAEEKGYIIETTQGKGYKQINFGHKKLHANHISKLFPYVLENGANVNKLIEKIAPGRPCTHKPFREIVNIIKQNNDLKIQ